MPRKSTTQHADLVPESFQVIFEQSPISTQIFSPTGDTIMVNKAWEKLWQIGAKEIVYKYNILKDKQLEKNNFMSLINEAFAGGKRELPVIRYEPNKTLPNISQREYVWVKAIIYPIKNKVGKITHVVLQHEDITATYEYQKKLQESEERFRQLLEYSTDAITLVDIHGRRLYSTPSRKNVLGYDTNDDIGQSIFTTIHPDDVEVVKKTFLKLAKRPSGSESMELRVKHKDGHWIWIRAIGTNLLHVPHVEAIVINYHDITQRKLDAQKLKESELKFRTFFDANIIGVFVSTLAGQYLEANDVFLKMVGYTREDLEKGKIHRDTLTAPEYAFLTDRAIDNMYKNGTSSTYEKIYIRKDKTRFPVLLAVAKVDNTDTCIGFALDITERRKSEEANYQLAAIVASSDDAIISKTLEGRITSWNEGAEKLFGYTAEEVVGKEIFVIIPPALHDEEVGILAKLRKGERILHYQTERRKKDGTLIPVSLTISPIKDDTGQIIGASKIARDITEQKRVEQQKNDFLSMASHELKTPLTSMKMFLELLGRLLDQTELEQAKYFVNRIHDQTNQLVELTNDLLDVSRIETGKLRLNIEAFRLDDLVRETVEAIATSSRTHKLLITQTEPLTIQADRYRVFQVLINLITNAIKYSPSGKDILISITQTESSAVVSVQDFGIGIKKSQQEKVFDRLYQVTDPEEKTYPGLGLGLYISKEIIQRHKGEIWVKSKKGVGSTFSFSLPIHVLQSSMAALQAVD